MIEFFKDGGWSMFVILLFGFVALAPAGFFAARPDGKHEGFLKWMCRALLWSTLTGLTSDFAAVFHYTTNLTDAEERSRTILQGMAESMSPVIMGLGFLTLTAFLTAIGRRRLDAKAA